FLALALCVAAIGAQWRHEKKEVRMYIVKRVVAAIAAATIIYVPLLAGDDEHNTKHELLVCDDSLKDEFKPDALTSVLLVKAYKKGEALTLADTPTTPPPPIPANHVSLAKLLAAPANPLP